MNKCYQKSAVRTYNPNTQTVTAALTQLNLLGSKCTCTGTSLQANTANIEVDSSGLYYISADVTFTPTAAGVEVIQLYNGSTPLPCAVSQTTGTVGAAFTTHVETVLQLGSCCACQPTLNVRVSGTAGGVNFVGMSVIRLA